MTPFYDYVAKQLVGKKVHFKCNCIVGLDVTGVCVSYEIAKTEIWKQYFELSIFIENLKDNE